MFGIAMQILFYTQTVAVQCRLVPVVNQYTLEPHTFIKMQHKQGPRETNGAWSLVTTFTFTSVQKTLLLDAPANQGKLFCSPVIYWTEA